MNATKNDLSFNEASLDFQAMLTTSKIAVGRCLDNISRYENNIRRDSINNDYTGVHCNANWLKAEAEYLEIASETLATLSGALERDNLFIVNKPKVKEEKGVKV